MDGTVLVDEDAYGRINVHDEAIARQEMRCNEYSGKDVEVTETQARKLKMCLESGHAVLAVLQELGVKPKDRPVWTIKHVESVNYVRL